MGEGVTRVRKDGVEMEEGRGEEGGGGKVVDK